MAVIPSFYTPLEKTLCLLEKDTEEQISPSLEVFRNLWNPKTCPEKFLPHLAWAMKVDIWQDSWTTAQKRRMIERYLVIRKLSGTLASITKAYEALGVEAVITEWWESKETLDSPYTFDIALLDEGQKSLTKREFNKLISITESLKPLRSRYQIKIVVKIKQAFGFVSLMKDARVIEDYFEPREASGGAT